MSALAERSCRVCGCTDLDGCFDDDLGVPCRWVEDEDEPLCSLCIDADASGERNGFPNLARAGFVLP